MENVVTQQEASTAQDVSSSDVQAKEIIWDKVGRIFVYILFGVLPIWFMPFTAFPAAEGKAFLGGMLIFGALAAWFAKVLATGRLALPKTYIWFAALGFLLFSLVSLLFSEARSIGFFGNGGQPDTFINFVLYVGALFIVPLFLKNTSYIMKAVFFFGISLAVLSLYSLLQFFGIFLIPFDFAKTVAFNPVGTAQDLGVLLGAGFAMFVAFLSGLNLSTLLKVLFSLGAAILGITLIFINAATVWLGLLVAIALIASWQVMHMRNKNRGQAMTRFSLPMFLVVVVAMIFFVRPPIASIVRLPATISPSTGATLAIAKDSYKANIGNIFVGSGPTTFVYEYLKHRPLQLNSTAFFGVRFTQGYSLFATLLVTSGVFGVAALFALLGYLIWTALRGISILGKSGSPHEKTAIVSFVSLVFLVFMWFFGGMNFTLLLFTFLLAGLVLASLRAGGFIPEWSFVFAKSPQRVFILSFLAVILLTGAILGVYLHGQKYLAAVMHTRGVQTFNKTNDALKAIPTVNFALNLDNNDRYWRTMTQLMLVRANDVLNDKTIDDAARKTSFQQVLQAAIQSAQRATEVNPADPANWEQLASVYDNVLFAVRDAAQFAIDNYMEAAKRNPRSPEGDFVVARAYIRAADNSQAIASALKANKGSEEEIKKAEDQQKDYLEKSLERLNSALVLKADYAPAHFLIAQVYDRQGNRKGAIEKTIEARDINPQDVGIGYQLGLLYFFDNQFGAAQKEFERVLLLSPNYSDARYFLGLVHDKRGEKEAAIVEFEKVSELNPDNEAVKKILENLRSGKEALEGLRTPQESTQPPVSQAGEEKAQDIPTPEPPKE